MSRGESSAWNELRTRCTCAGDSRPEGSTSAGAAGDEDDADEGEGVLGTATVRGAAEDAAVVAAAGTVADAAVAAAVFKFVTPAALVGVGAFAAAAEDGASTGMIAAGP